MLLHLTQGFGEHQLPRNGIENPNDSIRDLLLSPFPQFRDTTTSQLPSLQYIATVAMYQLIQHEREALLFKGKHRRAAVTYLFIPPRSFPYVSFVFFIPFDEDNVHPPAGACRFPSWSASSQTACQEKNE